MTFIALSMLLFANPAAQAANRLPIADDMPCERAIRYYEQHKKIYVVANGNDVVPIFGHKPASEWQNLRCSRGSAPRFYWVNTTDKARCVIAVYCQ